ncbi:hypothetical protein [Streptomyces altiplanensis]
MSVRAGVTGTALRMLRHILQGPLERTEGVVMWRFFEHGSRRTGAVRQ